VTRLAFVLLATVALPSGAGGQVSDWRWVLGELDDPERQSAYEEHARGIFEYYQGHGIMEGLLVNEPELARQAARKVVFLGPLEAFEELEVWLPQLATGGGGEVRVGGAALSDPGTGIYLRNAVGDVMACTGLDDAGYRSVFTVRTGHEDCTVLVGGRVRWHGSWADGQLNLASAGFARRLTDALREAPPSPDPPPWKLEPVYREDGATLTEGTRRRLAELCADARVLFVGENHWNEGVNRVFAALLTELMESPRGVRAVFLEYNDSFSEPLDHFVHLEDAEEALRFRAEILEHLVPLESELDLLELVRRHNLAHPERQVSLACHDMEWYEGAVIERLLVPFFDGLETRVRLSAARLRSARGRERLNVELAEALDEARERGHVGPHPFLTPDYVERVFENLRETVTLTDRTRQRQHYLIQHLVEHHGELLAEGLVVFKGGSFHGLRSTPEDAGYETEAGYLQRDHEPTRDRVRTLFLRGLGYDFSSVAQLDLSNRVGGATKYREFVRGYQADLGEGRVEPDERYVLRNTPLDPCEAFGIRGARRRGLRELWLLPSAGSGTTPPGCAPDSDYDAWILVLDGKLEPLRARPGAGD